MTLRRSSRRRILIASGVLLGAVAAVVTYYYRTVPLRNTDANHFDVILVLGTPAKKNGMPSRRGTWLVTEGVREYQAGRAEHIIVSGAAVANKFVEADVLAKLATEMGAPAGVVIEDRLARNTLQNIDNSAAIMREHGWTSVEVVGAPEHLHRASVMLAHTSLQWSTHPAPMPGRNIFGRALQTCVEAIGTTILRVFGLRAVPVLHGLKSVVFPPPKVR